MLSSRGIEATQAIQFFQSMHPLCSGAGGAKGPCADNGGPLVADRPTVLRLSKRATPGHHLGGWVTRPRPMSGSHGATFSVVGHGGALQRIPPATQTEPDDNQVLLRPAGTQSVPVRRGYIRPRPDLGFLGRALQLRSRLSSRSDGVFGPALFASTTRRDERRCTVSPGLLGLDRLRAAGAADPRAGSIMGDSVEKYDSTHPHRPLPMTPLRRAFAADEGTTGNLLNILDRLVGADRSRLMSSTSGFSGQCGAERLQRLGGSRWIMSDRFGRDVAHEILGKVGSPRRAPSGNPGQRRSELPDCPAFSSLPSASIGEVGFDCVDVQSV